MTDTEKLLRELVALPSVNPAFAPAGDPLTGEQKVADFLAAKAAQAGLDVDLQSVLPGRANLLATLRPSGRVKQRILLAPHMDTVPGMFAAQYVPRLHGGRLYGRGACDTKGSVAAMFSAICQLAAQGPRPTSTEIVFAGLIDEESTQAGSRALAASGFKADLAIVGEPTLLQIVTAHKGSLWLGLNTRGKAAHGARPELGRNAVHEMSRVVDLLETVYARRLHQRRHPVLGHATVNVGVIAGGTQPNIVPDACRIQVDRRTLPGETLKSVRTELLTMFRAKKLNVQIADEKQVPCLPMETDARLPLVQQLFTVAGQKKAIGVDYFCDASVFSAAGIPSVVFGPGDIAQAHTADEWISLRSLAEATVLLTRFLRSLP
jgi:acetylornithine deacetylase/succinyl-diaminopimelate desuccinylase family protein